MKTSAVRVQAVAEPEVGAVVLGQDVPGFLLEDLEARLRGLADPFGVDRLPGVRRIGNWAHRPEFTRRRKSGARAAKPSELLQSCRLPDQLHRLAGDGVRPL